MTHSDHNSPMGFNFEGQFLGFVDHAGKLKYARLRVLSEEMQVKLPKAMRQASALSLNPGDSIRVTGIGKFDRQTHELKLKAMQIQSLSQPERSIAPVPHASPALSTLSPCKPNLKPQIKILVCQKSGCLKRGGKELCQALDQTLRDRDLKQSVTIKRTGCLKRCSSAPNLVIMPGNQRYTEVRSKSLPRIADAIARLVNPPQ